MFTFMYNHLNLRIIVLSLPYNEPFISLDGAGRLLWRPYMIKMHIPYIF